MARETKIGVALMVLLLGVFGGVAYKKWDALKSAVAAKSDKGDAKAEEKPAVSPSAARDDDLQPDVNPFAATASAPAPPSGDEANPFGDTAAAQAKPFSRADNSAVSDATPPAQAEPAARPSETTTAAPSEFADAAPAASDAAAVGDDPFGNAATTSTSDAAVADVGQPLADDPFGAAGEGAAATAEAPAEPVASEPAIAAAEANDPFGGAADPAAPGTQAAAETLAPTPDSTFASADSEPAATPPQTATADDPFGDAAPQANPTPANMADAAPQPRPEPGVFGEPADSIASAEATPASVEPQPDTAFAEPPSKEPQPPAGRTDFFTVGEKDTYWSISQRVYGSPAYFQALTEFNRSRIRDPRRLRPGMTVLTPPVEELQARYPKLIAKGGTAPAEGTARPGFLINEAGRPAYRVGEDDTLSKIAQAHLGRASRWVQIYEMNRRLIPNPKALKPGTVLELPGDASRVRIASGK